jgi:ribonuclease P protein component
VERNKVKRRLREMLRVIHNSAPLAGDAIVVAGPRAYAASFDALRDELDVIWRRAASRVGPA